MTISTEDLKPKSEDKKKEKPMPVIAVTESLKPIEGVKNWIITLTGAGTYTHPETRRLFNKGVAVYTSNEALAIDCQNNSYFNVQEA